MTKLVKNPSGIIVEIDDDEIFRKCMGQKGFEYILPDSPEAKAFYMQRNTPTPVTADNEDEPTQLKTQDVIDIHLAAPSPHHDGYGQMVGHIKSALLQYGIVLNTRFNNQKVGLAFGYPEQINNLKTPVKILFTMFESTKVPDEWEADLKKADLIIVPSKFCQKAFEEIGIETTLCPIGYDSSTFDYKPKNPDKEPFTF
jgi:hypothetical protein